MELFPCRIRRKFGRGLKRKPMALIKKLRKKKKEAPVNEKPDVVKTQLRDMVIVPEMTGSIVGVHNGKTYTQVEIKVGVKTVKTLNEFIILNDDIRKFMSSFPDRITLVIFTLSDLNMLYSTH